MKRHHLLILLLLGLVGAAVYAIWYNPSDQARTSPVGHSGKAHQGSLRKPGAQELALKLELLEGAKDGFSEVKRDIFNFYTPPPAPAPPPPVVKQPLPPPPPVATAPAAAPIVREAPAARFRYLGMLDKEGDQAVFLATGKELYIVRNGMRFGKNNQFFIEDLSPEEISIRQQGRTSLIRVSLVEAEEPSTSMPSSTIRGQGSPFSGAAAGRPASIRGQGAPVSVGRQGTPTSVRGQGAPFSTGDQGGPSIKFKVPPIAKPQLKSFKRYQP